MPILYGNACITNLDMENGDIIKDSFIKLNEYNNIGNNCQAGDWGDIQDLIDNNASISYLPYGNNNNFNTLLIPTQSKIIPSNNLGFTWVSQ